MRRRPIRRPFRRSGHRRVPPALQHANELMENGNYAEAALAFEKIAKRAKARRGARAPHFYLRAGKAHILAENVEKGMLNLNFGLKMIAAKHHWEPLQRLGQRTIDELKKLGLENEAQEIAAFLEKSLPEKTDDRKQISSRPLLPTRCLDCGAPIHSDEVKWIDKKTAECVFCGNPVRGEN